MSTHSKCRHVALALVLAVGAAPPCLAEGSAEDLWTSGNIGGVRSFFDPFTDAHELTVLQLNTRSDSSLADIVPEVFSVRVEYHEGGLFAVAFRGRDTLPVSTREGADVEVTYRIDAQEAVTLTATWSGYARLWVSEAWLEELSAAILGAETLIYRVGPKGDILRISVPVELPEVIAEFRRRIAEAAAAAGEG